MQADNGHPITVDIRKFLVDAFSDEELTTLCFDYFRDVHDKFTLGMTKGQKVQLLIEHCERHDSISNLLAAIQRARPEQYRLRFPQVARPQAKPSQRARDPRQIFISHAHEDAEFAHRLASDLKQRGWYVWITPDSIRPGEKWVEAIERGLAESGVFVLVITSAATKSNWVRSESNVAIELEHHGHLRFIPLNVERCEPPLLWTGYQSVSFGDHYEHGLTELTTELMQTSYSLLEKSSTLPERPQTANESDEKKDKWVPVPLLVPMPPLDHIAKTPATFPRIVSKATSFLRRNPLFVAGISILVLVSVVLVGVTVMNYLVIPIIRLPGAANPPQPTKVPSPTKDLGIAQAIQTLRPTTTGGPPTSEDDSMVNIPAGNFLMGCGPTYETVYVDAYSIDKYEVTNAQYAQCEDAGVCSIPKEKSSRTRSSYYGDPAYSNFPVINVDWDQANTFCKWKGKYLPTAAQWQEAARGASDTRTYPWGEQAVSCKVANYKGCVGDTTAVGSYPDGASPYGVMDMAGNVWEWISEKGGNLGGSWHPTSSDVRVCSKAGNNSPPWYGDTNGIRCASSPKS
jgi:formylglycine-generating enzyme required for sulfatase activity